MYVQDILVHKKDMIKKIIGCSPDLWDAFKLTFASPVASLGVSDRLAALAGIHNQAIKSDYDPYDEIRMVGG